MKILDSKIFDTPEPGMCEAVMAMLKPYESLYGYTVVVQIRDPITTRKKKTSAKKELKTMIRLSQDVWEQGEYRFLFKEREYYWKGVKIDLTAGEALYLYWWLVRGEQDPKQRYFLRNLRRRFGKEFLAEAADV